MILEVSNNRVLELSLEVNMLSGVSSKQADPSVVAQRKRTATKVIAGTVVTAAVVAGGLALGHKSGAFSKGAGKLIVSMKNMLETAKNAGNVTVFKDLKFKSLAASVKGLVALNGAGKFVAEKSAFAAKFVADNSKVAASFVMENAKKAFSAAKGLLKKVPVFAPKA